MDIMLKLDLKLNDHIIDYNEVLKSTFIYYIYIFYI